MKQKILFIALPCIFLICVLCVVIALNSSDHDTTDGTNIALNLVEAQVITTKGSTEIEFINESGDLTQVNMRIVSFGPNQDLDVVEKKKCTRFFPHWEHKKKIKLRMGAGEFVKYATACKVYITCNEGNYEKIFEWR